MEKTLKSEIKALEDKVGHIDADALWKAAKGDPSSALYRRYNWNLEEAAIEHWRATSRELIREYKIVVTVTNTTREIEVRQFVRDPVQRTGYRNTEKLKNSPEMAAASLLDMCRRARGQLQNASNLGEYWSCDTSVLTSSIAELDQFIGLLEQTPEIMFPRKEKPKASKRRGDDKRPRPTA